MKIKNNIKYLPVEVQFAAIAGEQPEAIAIERGDTRICYAGLNNQANKYANYFLHLGIEKGKTLLVFVADPVKVIPLLIACFRAGVIFVPLNTQDTESRIHNIINISQAEYVVLDNDGADRFAEIAVQLHSRFSIINLDDEELTRFDDFVSPPPINAPDKPCYIYFSSGSTGTPKGIAGSRSGIAHFIAWEIETFVTQKNVRVSQLTQPYYDAFLRDIFLPLCAKGTICIPEGLETILDTNSLLAWIQKSRVNIIHTIPSVFRRLLEQEDKTLMFQSVSHILLAGERVLPNDVGLWYAGNESGTQLVNLYGPSETVMTKLFYKISPHDKNRKTIPVGQPMQNVEVLLLDEQGRVVEDGKIGEICIATDFLLCGYYNQQDLTDKMFVPDPRKHGNRIYKTGDFGRVLDDEGNIEFLGRKDQQVKINGIRVELSEIEGMLNAHPGIKESVVHAFDKQEHTTIVAYVVTDNTDTVELKHRMFEYLAEQLPVYMQPRHYQLIDEIPRLPNGKVKYAALPHVDISDKVSTEQPFFKAVLNDPDSLTEVKIARIWSAVLGIESIGVDENFFEVGGESLLVFNVLNDIKTEFNTKIPLAAFLKQPTIKGLARQIEQTTTATASPVIELNSGNGNGNPFWLVHPPGGDVLAYAKLASRLENDCPVYGLRYPTLYGGAAHYVLEELGRYYADLIRGRQNNKPCIIGGWSAGGIIALEVARQLNLQGIEVEQVILFDTVSPYPMGSDKLNDREYKSKVDHASLSSLVRFVGDGFGLTKLKSGQKNSKQSIQMLRLLADQFMGARLTTRELENNQLEASQQLEQIVQQSLGEYYNKLQFVPFRLLYLIPARIRLKIIFFVARLLRLLPETFDDKSVTTFMNAFRENLISVCNYRPTRIDANITLIKAVNNSGQGPATSSFWQEVSTRQVSEVEIAGDHYSIFREPKVGELARQLVKLFNI